ncbi:Os03g0679800, partial [Oryza sativa Japonica Group]
WWVGWCCSSCVRACVFADVGGGMPPQMEFLMACTDGDVARLKEVVDSMDEDDRQSLTSVRMEGYEPLFEAASSGKIDLCKYLVEELGFDVNAEANHDSGMTPLFCAVLDGQEITVKYFLDKGADPNKKDAAGFAPLHEAAKKGHVGIARLLLSKGASVDVSSSEGTPLHVAASNGKSSTVQILLEHRANPNVILPDCYTPLTAVLSATPEIVNESECLKCMKLLVKAGAIYNLATPDTPLKIATRNGLTECVAYLLEITTVKLSEHDKGSDGDRKSKLKLHGGKAFEEGDYAGAIIFYTEAMKLDPADATLYSNRSLCHLRSGAAQEALLDANDCIKLKPEWTKGHYRKGCAHMALKEYEEACTAFMAGTKLNPLNDEMQDAFWEAAKGMMYEHMAGKRVSSVD